MLSVAAATDVLPMLCIGHSHLRCVQVASAEAGMAIDAINFWDDSSVVLDYPDNPTLIPSLQQRFRDYPGTVFSFVGGGAHTVIGLLSHPRRFDFVLPEAPWLPLAEQSELIPFDALHELLLEQMQPFLRIMRHVRSLTRHRLVHMESPPPCSDERRMQREIPWSVFPGMLHEIAPRPLRYKLWRLHSQIVADFCTRHDIAFAAHPRQAIDAQGFLHADFYHDGIHANSKYGALLLAQMKEAAI